MRLLTLPTPWTSGDLIASVPTPNGSRIDFDTILEFRWPDSGDLIVGVSRLSKVLGAANIVARHGNNEASAPSHIGAPQMSDAVGAVVIAVTSSERCKDKSATTPFFTVKEKKEKK